MKKSNLLKTFIILQNKNFELHNLLDDNWSSSDTYHRMYVFLKKVGFESSESHLILGSLIATLGQYSEAIVFTPETNLDDIIIPDSNDRQIDGKEYGRYVNDIVYVIPETYSELQARVVVEFGLHGEFDQEVVDSEYEYEDGDIDYDSIEII